MKNSGSSLLGIVGIAACASSLSAATLYWDIDGATPGAGGATPGGAWTSALWSTSSAGDVATGSWAANDSAFFSAGSDAVGSFTVSGNATASSILIEEGDVRLSGTITLGAGSVTVNSGATLTTDNSARISMTAGSTYYINGGTLKTINTGSAGSFVDPDAKIVINGGATLIHTASGVLNIIQTATTITGTGGITKDGAGILAIASASTYTGDTIINGGTLRIRSLSNRLPVGTDVIINAGAAFDPASSSAISQEIASVSGAGNVVFSASGTMVVNQAAGTKTLSGAITDGTAFGKVQKKGAGEWILAGLNTFDGTFTQTEGTTTVNSGAALMGAAGDLVVNGGTLHLNNSAQTVLSLAGGGGTINLGSGHVLTVNPSTGNKTNASVISGLGALVKSGAGTLTLAGASDFTGGTTVTGGKLVVDGSLAGPVTVDTGTLGGNGYLGGTVIVKDKIEPGNSIGTFSIGGILLLASTSRTTMEIDPSQAQNADLISATAIALGGDLVINQIGGSLQGGQTFNLFDGTLIGNFSNITGLPDVSANFWSWNTSQLGEGGTGVLILVPEPTAVSMLMMGFLGLALWRRSLR